MTSTLEAPRTSTEPAGAVVRLRLITREAEAAFAELTPEHREKLRNVMTAAVPTTRIKKWKGHNPTGLRRIRVDDNLRIAYRVLDGGACVFHAGPHEAADRFARTHTAQTPFVTIPLKESAIVKKKPPVPATLPITAPLGAPVAADPPQKPNPGAEALAAMLSQWVQASVNAALDDGLTTLNDLAEAQVEPVQNGLAEVHSQLDAQAARLAGLEAAVATQPAAAAEAEARAAEARTADRTATQAKLDAVAGELSRLETGTLATAGELNRLESSVSATAAAATGRFDALDGVLATFLNGQQEQAKSGAAMAAEVTTLGQHLKQVGTEVGAVAARIEGAVDRGADRVTARTAEAFSGLNGVVRGLTQEHARTLAAVAALGSGLSKVQSEFAAQLAETEARLERVIGSRFAELVNALQEREEEAHRPGRIARALRRVKGWIGTRFGYRPA